LRSIVGAVYTNVAFNDVGDYVFFSEKIGSRTSSEAPVFQRVKIDSGESTIIDNNSADLRFWDVSADGNIVIYSAKNNKTNLTELIKFDVSNMQKKIISQNFTGTFVQFWEQYSSELLFVDTKDGRQGIFSYNLSTQVTRRLLGLVANETYNSLTQQSKYTFYTTRKGVFVTDLSQPKNLKQVLGY